MRVVVTGGGTGGHIYPALAFASKMEEKFDADIVYVGSAKRMEKDIVPRYGYVFKKVHVVGLHSGTFAKAKFAILLLISTIQIFFYFLKIKPKLVIGTGGFVSAPAIIAGHFLKIPTVLYDADLHHGRATKFLKRFAKIIFSAFDDVENFFDEDEFYNIGSITAKKLARSKTKNNILFIFGSSGSETMNQLVLEYIKEQAQNNFSYKLITGVKHFEIMQSTLKDYDIEVIPYAYDVFKEISWADIIVSRGGSLFLHEIFAALRPALIIPSPYVKNNEQLKNVEYFYKSGVCEYVEEKDIDSKVLADNLQKLVQNYDEYVNNMEMLTEIDGLEIFIEKVCDLIGN